MGKLDNTVAIVTGASKGLGAAITRRLVQEGARVIACARNKETLESLAKENPEQILIYPCDISDSTQVHGLIDFTLKETGQIDILVNNAGVGHFGQVQELSEENWDEMMATNLKGPFLTCKYSIPHLIKTRGHIINISSVAGTVTFSGGGGYCASKFGLMALSDVLTQELKPHQVRVTTICPGSIHTDFFQAPDYALQPEQVAEAVHSAVTAPKGVIYNQIIMRPQVPPEAQK